VTAADLNGVTLEYEVLGDAGIPLLLVHGLGAQLVMWPDPFVELFLERGFQVIRFDNRDIGLSTKTDAPAPTIREIVTSTLFPRRARASYLLTDMADDAAALLDHLGVESAHVVGASMGGMIAQWLAIAHPQKVRSLTSIMSNTGDRRHGRVAPSMLRRLQKLAGNPKDLTVQRAIDRGVAVYRLIGGPHFEEEPTRQVFVVAANRSVDVIGTAHQTVAIAASPDRTPYLRRLDVPTLVIHGLLDQLVLPSGGIATAKAIPGSRLLAFPDMAHDLPRSRWPEIVDAIVANTARAGTVAAR
jgi:pimeloyl-ACP methyl ester carboxylesterase